MNDDDRLHLDGCMQQILRFRDERDWGRFHNPKDLAAALAIEAAELQEVFLWRSPQEVQQLELDGDARARAMEEIADTAIYLLLLVHRLGIDLRTAILDKLEANGRRYPVDEHRGRARKARPLDPRGD